MSRPTTGYEAIERARKDVMGAKTADQLRTAQAALLPLDPGFSLAQTAAIVGRSVSWVARERRRYLKTGGHTDKATRGGRRRQLINEAEEIELVKAGFMLTSHSFFETPRSVIRDKLEKRIGRPVADSTLDAMIKRVVQKFMPDCAAYNMARVSAHLTEIWMRERVLVQKAMGKKFAV